MLILTRKEKETICIGDDIRVTVVGVHNGQVRLGIAAPKATQVHRQEIYDKIQTEKAVGLDQEK